MAAASQVFQQAPRAVVHLRAQLGRKRFGLIFGAGISHGLQFPQWPDLVHRIETHPDVQAESVLSRCAADGTDASPITRTLSTITQMLFTRYRANWISRRKFSEPITFLHEQQILTSWLRLIHTQLYKDANIIERDAMISSHPYLERFKALIKSSPLTVTYNFDDSLERMLYNGRTEDEEIKTRGFEVIDKPNSQFQKESSVIYHPNGYLPSTFEDGASPQVVFADNEFQDQLISATTGRYLHLSNHLFSNTCLLVGISLNDATLQSLLRQNAVNYPGNIHYIVHFMQPGEALDDEVRRLIFRANFESYNLYTLFLDDSGIAELAGLLSMKEGNFRMKFRQDKPKYVYYVIGSIGAGKTTAASNFRSLITYDEWVDARRPGLAVPESELSPEERQELNEWVADQFMKKNFALGECKEGLHLIDRCPLDPLTFGDHSERQEKAQRLIQRITSASDDVEPGHIIYLEAGPEEVQVRSTFKHKFWKREKCRELIRAIDEIYSPIEGITTISTRGRTAEAVAHEMAKVIFLGEYRPIDVGAHLRRFMSPAESAT